MPKCYYDCKNLDWDYVWDGEDETIFFQCMRKDKSRAFVEDLSVGECDKYKPYKDKNTIPYKIDREFLFEIDDFETVEVTSLEDDNERRYIKGRKK